MIVVEQNDRRVLGAVRFIDAATGRAVLSTLTVSAPGVTLVRNAHNTYVLTGAPGFEAYTDSFAAAPSTPPLGSASFVLAVSDPAGKYLARRVTVALPRDPDPAHADQPTSLFQALAAPLYPSPAGEVAAGAAILRASVKRAGAGVGGALLRVVRTSDGQVLARGLSDDRGEALVPVPGIPVMTWQSGSNAVLSPETDVTVTAIYDAAAIAPPDPDDLEARRASLASASVELKLASRREDFVSLGLS